MSTHDLPQVLAENAISFAVAGAVITGLVGLVRFAFYQIRYYRRVPRQLDVLVSIIEKLYSGEEMTGEEMADYREIGASYERRRSGCEW